MLPKSEEFEKVNKLLTFSLKKHILFRSSNDTSLTSTPGNSIDLATVILAMSLHQRNTTDLKRSVQNFNDVMDEVFPGFTTVLIHRCLDALDIDNTVTCGYLAVPDTARVPHMWLKVKDCVLDTTMSGVLNISQASAAHHSKEYTEVYREMSHFSHGNLPKSRSLKNKSKFRREERRKMKIDFFLKNPDHALALCFNKTRLYNHWFMMARYMFDTFQVSHRDMTYG